MKPEMDFFDFSLQRKWSLAALIVLVTIVPACENPDNKKRDSETDIAPVSALKLNTYTNCDQYRLNLEASLVKTYTEFQDYLFMEGGGITATDDSLSPQRNPDGISQTNVQEAGVDEADVVKTDSSGNLYLLNGTSFVIARGFPPAQLQELSRLDLGAAGSNLYFDETSKQVVVLSSYGVASQNNSASSAPESDAIYPYYSNQSVLTFIDVTDPANPVIKKRLSLDGNAVSSRRVGNRIHRVGFYQTPTPAALTQDSEFQALVSEYQQVYWYAEENPVKENQLARLKQAIADQIHAVMAETELSDLLPALTIEENANTTTNQLLSCENISHPEVTTRTGLLMVSSFDLDGDNFQTSAVVGNAWQTYASQDNLYLLQTSGAWWWGDNAQQQTVIHKFAVSAEAPVYTTTGSVPGWVNDQFSLSEHQGFLRIATTYGRRDGNNNWITSNELFVLEDKGQGDFAVAGEVRGFAPGERIFSARFMGDKGFIVTFRRIDPLFSFDLSGPAAPRLMGELEIPGFSSYMHPLGDTHLLTIGRAGDVNGAGDSLQLQIFDVSDLSDPRLVHKITPETAGDGYSWSLAMFNHLAFTYYAPSKLLVFPLSVYNYGADEYFNGFVAFRADAQLGFTELGRIDHKDLAYDHLCVNGEAKTEEFDYRCNDNGYVYWVDPKRSVIMTSAEEDYIYTLSNIGVKATNANNANAALGSIVF